LSSVHRYRLHERDESASRDSQGFSAPVKTTVRLLSRPRGVDGRIEQVKALLETRGHIFPEVRGTRDRDLGLRPRHDYVDRRNGKGYKGDSEGG
jgi:hypothetical protein